MGRQVEEDKVEGRESKRKNIQMSSDLLSVENPKQLLSRDKKWFRYLRILE